MTDSEDSGDDTGQRAPRDRRDTHGKPNHERWMISYADMLTLLLAVFIVLYAVSKHNPHKYKVASESLLHAFQGTPPQVVDMPTSPHAPMRHLSTSVTRSMRTPAHSHNKAHPAVKLPPPPKPVPRIPHAAMLMPRKTEHKTHKAKGKAANQVLSMKEQQLLQPSVLALKKLHKKLSTLLEPEVRKHEIHILSQPLSLRIRLNAKILFKTGRAKLTKQALTILKPLGEVLGGMPPGYRITVQGYTDNTPIHTARFPSNWQLSTARALSVLLLFRHSDAVSGTKLSAQGFGKYHPVATNKTSTGRARNRRVSVVITAPRSRSKRSSAPPPSAKPKPTVIRPLPGGASPADTHGGTHG